MSPIDRRTLLGNGAGLVATASACSTTGVDGQPNPAPLVPDGAEVFGVGSIGKGASLDVAQPHHIDVGALPAKTYDGGRLQSADQQSLPLLRGQDVSGVLVRLAPGGIREPHWHPAAWEFHYVISGRGRFTIVDTRSYTETFDAGAGTAVFLPQGSFHYFENTSATEDYVAWLVFNTSTSESDDDIGITGSLSAMPPDVLGAVFGADPATFASLPKRSGPVTIVRRP